MLNKNIRRFVIKGEYGPENYATGIGTYTDGLHNAKIFHDNPKDFEKYGDEIILLDTEEGLELLAREIESLDSQIPEEERRLRNKKEGRDNLVTNFPEIGEYVKRHNKWLHPLIGISEEKKSDIIEKIVEESFGPGRKKMLHKSD